MKTLKILGIIAVLVVAESMHPALGFAAMIVGVIAVGLICHE